MADRDMSYAKLSATPRMMINSLRWALPWFVAGLVGQSLSADVVTDLTPADSEFTFVVLGDSQFDDPVAFNRIVGEVARLRPAFVVQVGDMIEGYNVLLSSVRGEWQRFQDQIAPLGDIAFLAVPGNHDVYGAMRRPDRGATKLFEDIWGPVPRTISYQNTLIVLLNNDQPGKEQQIGDEQREWLDGVLSQRTETHAFVFLHRPPDSLKDAAAFHETLVRGSVHTVFYGHHHHLHSYERDGVRYVMTNAAADTGTAFAQTGSFDHFLNVSVRDDIVSTAVIHAGAVQGLGGVAPIDNYDLFNLIRNFVADTAPLVDGLASIEMTNPLARDLDVYVECRSADDRWEFDPQVMDRLTIAAGEMATLRLQAVQRWPSEAEPTCELSVPYQVTTGRWLQQRFLVRLETDN